MFQSAPEVGGALVCANEKTPQHDTNTTGPLREGNFGRILPQNSLTPKHVVEFSHDALYQLHSGNHAWRDGNAECFIIIRGIKLDPLAHELATWDGTRPYLDCVIKAYRNNAVGLDAALQCIRDLPLEKRYTPRVLSALKSSRHSQISSTST
jgi:hypothetical protein